MMLIIKHISEIINKKNPNNHPCTIKIGAKIGAATFWSPETLRIYLCPEATWYACLVQSVATIHAWRFP